MSRRESAVAGSFYPSQCAKVEAYFEQFNSMLNQDVMQKITQTPRAIIVPHAGYMYSGFTANVAYQLASKRTDIKRIIVIGPSHRVGFLGASVAQFDRYASPCGDLSMDVAFSKTLEARYRDLHFMAHVHQEHSTEVQIPFIAHYFKTTPVVEIVYGQIDTKVLAEVVEYLLTNSSNLIVISTDLSHFYTQEEANKLDSICVEGIRNMNVSFLDTGCEACGMIGVKAMLLAAKSQKLQTQILDYRTSADASGDESRVVGYLSALIY
jgi:hypothetical protein